MTFRFPQVAAAMLTASFALLAFTGCNRALDRADLVFINGGEPEPLDPVASTAQATGRIIYALREGLMRWNVQGKPEPGVAEKWEISPDGRVYTFHLRHNAKWSNGDPVKAQDFAWSWRRTLLPESAAEYSYQLYYIRNAKPFNEGKITDFNEVGVRVLDDYTLEVTLDNPTPFFLDLCAFVTLNPVHRPSVEKYDDWALNPEHHIGNGPFTLTEWRLFDRLRMVKNPHYWDAAGVKLKSIDALPAARPNTAFNFYATGVADLLLDKSLTPTPLMQDLRKRKDFHAAPFLGSYFIRFNCIRPPFNDPRVRRAFCLAVDKLLLTEKITRGGEPPAWSLVPPGAGAGEGYRPPDPPVEALKDGRQMIEEARKLLADAGYAGGKNFPLFYYLYRSDNDLDQDLAVELQSMFREVLGVSMQLTRQEWTVFLNTQSKVDYDVCRSTWVGDYNDPNTFLDMFLTGGGNNRTGWSNKAYDEFIAAAAREVDIAKRDEIFRQAERILVSEECPICPIFYYQGILFFDDEKLGGVENNLLDEHPLRTIYWKNR